MRFFYIDTENVGARAWCPYLYQLRKSDVVILVYTQNSKTITVKNVPLINSALCRFESLFSDCGTSNALDFVLVSDLSRRTVTAKKSQFFIVSEDHGYDSVIEHLHKRLVNVNRIASLSSVFINR